MKKKVISFVIAVAMCAACALGIVVTAADDTDEISLSMRIDDPMMTVNGTEKEIDPGAGTSPVIINERTLMPVRAVVEKLGGTVEWNGDKQQAVLSCGSDVIVLTINSTEAYLNDTPYTLDTAPVIINDRTMIPIRFIAESFGFNVEWIQSESRVVITGTINSSAGETGSEPSADTGKVLTVYFTVPETDGTDAVSSASRVVDNGEVVGNVEFIAETVQKETDSDIFRIETVQEYPGTHQALLEFAADEMDKNIHPELKTHIGSLDQYDTIFIGYPIWNADLPMPMYSFFDEYDLSGKTIIPFTAHGGSGFAGTIDTISELEPNAKVINNGFSVSRNSVSQARADIISWVSELGFAALPRSDSGASNTLVAYFSQSGNTKEAAEYISEKTGADLFRIEAEEPYTGNTQAIADRAKSEGEQNARPKVSGTVSNMEQYDTVFIGYPIWYYNAPMIIGTFLESYDLSGKTIIPFCTSASSDISVSMDLINASAENATVKQGLTANGGNDEIDSWLKGLGF